VRSVGALDPDRPRTWAQRGLSWHAWAVFLFLYLPIALLVFLSFNESRLVGTWRGFSLRWYEAMVNTPQVLSSIRNSLVVAFWSTLISTVVGTAAALSLERFRFRGQRLFDSLIYLPVIIPDIAMGVMLLLFFAQVFGPLTGIGFGIPTISMAHIAFNISFVAIVVRARVADLDPAMLEAASDLYATPARAFRRVTLPLIMPGIAGGALLALTLSLDDVVITTFVAGPGSTTLPVYVFGLVRRGVTPMINAVSTVMLLASMLLVLASFLVQRRRRPATPVAEGIEP
jgi:spermidine/putrescine transport system permease protein